MIRKRLLVDEWVVIAPQRADRPRQLEVGHSACGDDFCPFCPENAEVTPPTIQSWDSPAFAGEPWAIRSIPNKFPALRIEDNFDDTSPDGAPFYQSHGGLGAHEVIIEAPRHLIGWQELGAEHLGCILGAWQERMADLRQDRRLHCAIVFKNHGARAGATLAHIHSQLIALPILPSRLQRELDGARTYFKEHNSCTICDMLDYERQNGERIVLENDQAVAVAPYGSRTAFEIWIMPRDHSGDFLSAGPELLAGVAKLVDQILPLWHKAIGDVAYNFVLHCLPFDLADEPYYHWHLELIPRTGQIAGFEWGSDIFINATPSEVAAHHLRNLADLESP